MLFLWNVWEGKFRIYILFCLDGFVDIFFNVFCLRYIILFDFCGLIWNFDLVVCEICIEFVFEFMFMGFSLILELVLCVVFNFKFLFLMLFISFGFFFSFISIGFIILFGKFVCILFSFESTWCGVKLLLLLFCVDVNL